MVAFVGADFSPLRGAARTDDATAGYLSSSAGFEPCCPAALPRPGRRAGSAGLVGGGPPAPPVVISIPGMQCGHAGPGSPSGTFPSRCGSGLGPAGLWYRRGLVPSLVRRWKEWEVGKGIEWGSPCPMGQLQRVGMCAEGYSGILWFLFRSYKSFAFY